MGHACIYTFCSMGSRPTLRFKPSWNLFQSRPRALSVTLPIAYINTSRRLKFAIRVVDSIQSLRLGSVVQVWIDTGTSRQITPPENASNFSCFIVSVVIPKKRATPLNSPEWPWPERTPSIPSFLWLQVGWRRPSNREGNLV
jgi:hypothetical protein